MKCAKREIEKFDERQLQRVIRKTSEVMARERRLSCFCGRQDRLPRKRSLRERSCFLPGEVRRCKRTSQTNAERWPSESDKGYGRDASRFGSLFRWGSAVLVWSTLLDEGRILSPQKSRDGFEYVAIPNQSFLELMQQHSNLVIFDVHADRRASGWSELIFYRLPISAVDLPRVLKWLPPASTVVFCCRRVAERLDTRIKTILWQLGIETVYFLDDGQTFRPSHCDLAVTADPANREMQRRTLKETRRRL